MQDLTCYRVPCYLNEDVTLSAFGVNEVTFTSDSSFINCYSVMKNDCVLAYLEIDPKLAGPFPNMGVVKSTFNKQSVGILVGQDTQLKAGTKIGYMVTNFVKNHDEINSSNRPRDNCMYTIMTDQEVANALKNNKDSAIKSNNPNAVLDKIERFGNKSMSETPEEFKIGANARFYPPRDMVEFDRIHREWEINKTPDGIPDEWTIERIKNEFKLPENELTTDQTERFYSMIHKYRVAFLRRPDDLHLNTIGEVDLVLNNDAQYHQLSVKPNRGTPEADKLIKNILKDFLVSGVIKHGSGPYSSRVFVVYRRSCQENPDPKPRLVIDHQNINRALVPCAKYLAGVDTLLQKVQNHTFYSKMDLKGAYHQVGITENKNYISSIITVDAQFVFNVMSFGLCVAPAFF